MYSCALAKRRQPNAVGAEGEARGVGRDGLAWVTRGGVAGYVSVLVIGGGPGDGRGTLIGGETEGRLSSPRPCGSDRGRGANASKKKTDRDACV